jgi:glycosyltransferase involved in cell wall biosynthesis
VWTQLEALSAGGRVSFPGRKPDVRDAYRGCDIIICPSRRESFGRIAAEAMTNGLPVVASDIGPFRDLVGDAGLLFPTGDAASAAAAVRKLVEQPALRDQLGRSALRRATPLEPGPIVRRFTELYGLGDAAT